MELTLFTCLFNAWNRLQDGLHNPVEPPDDIIGWKEWRKWRRCRVRRDGSVDLKITLSLRSCFICKREL